MRIRKGPRPHDKNAEEERQPDPTSTPPLDHDRMHNSQANRSEEHRQAPSAGVAASAPSDGRQFNRGGMISPNYVRGHDQAVLGAVEAHCTDAGISTGSRRPRKNPRPQRHLAVEQELEIVTEPEDDVVDESNYHFDQNIDEVEEEEEEGSTVSCN